MLQALPLCQLAMIATCLSPGVLQVNEIVRLAPRARQTILFSATMTDEVKSLATLSLRQPVRLAADEPSTAPVRLAQEVLRLKVRALVQQVSTAGCACQSQDLQTCPLQL